MFLELGGKIRIVMVQGCMFPTEMMSQSVVHEGVTEKSC